MDIVAQRGQQVIVQTGIVNGRPHGYLWDRKNDRRSPEQDVDCFIKLGYWEHPSEELKRELADSGVEKGDLPGHPFHGNQYTEGYNLAQWDADKKVWCDTEGTPHPEWVQQLKIPPTWKHVIVAEDPKAKVLAVGTVTARDGTEYDKEIYAEWFKEQNAEAKYARVGELDKQFDEIKKIVDADCTQGVEEAIVLRLIMNTGVRPGSERDTGSDVQAFGATTLRGSHVVELKSGVRLRFVGKSGVENDIKVTDPEVAQDLLKRKASVGPRGKLFPETTDAKLRDYSYSLDGGDFSPKDFRTLLSTRFAQEEVEKVKRLPKDEKTYKKAVRKIAKAVAERIGNTAAVQLQSYILPSVFSKWKLRAGVA